MIRKFILISTLLTCAASAQDVADLPTHAGLLGRRYAGAAMMIQRPNEISRHVNDYDATATATLNFPVPWTSEIFPAISQDIFFSGSDMNPVGNEQVVRRVIISKNMETYFGREVIPDALTGENISDRMFDTEGQGQNAFPPLQLFDFEAFNTYDFQFGTTLYAEWRDDVRPFLQFGYAYRTWQEYSVLFVSSPAIGLHTQIQTVTEHDHRLLCNVGFEWDLTSNVALRSQINVETSGDFVAGSLWSAQAVWWPTDRWFISGGPVCDLGGQMPGGTVGFGVSF